MNWPSLWRTFYQIQLLTPQYLHPYNVQYYYNLEHLMRKCLQQYRRNQFFILSDYQLQIQLLMNRAKAVLQPLQCQVHEGDQIIGICIESSCEQVQRIFCSKCIIYDHSASHNRDCLLLITDIATKKAKFFALLQFLGQDDTFLTNRAEFLWLKAAIIDGQNDKYPELSVDSIFEQIQDNIMQNLEDMKSQYEQSVKSQTNSPSNNQLKLQQLIRFKHQMEEYLKETQTQININFQVSIKSDRETMDRKSGERLSFHNLRDNQRAQSYIQDFSMDQSLFAPSLQDSQINQQDSHSKDKQSFLPTLNFVDKSEKGWLSKSKVQFKTGGKLIHSKNGTLLTKEALGPESHQSVEMRIRIRSLLSDCFHIGVIEQTPCQLNCNLESAGVWACLFDSCQKPRKMEQVQEFVIEPEAIISIQLSFDDDVIEVAQFRRDGVQVLFKKQGTLLKQRHHFFLRNSSEVDFEVIN